MRSFILALIAVALLLPTGCGNPHEALVVNAIAILKEIADELSSIKDAASAEAAGPRLKELGGRWRANERRLVGEKPLSMRDMAALNKEFGGQYEEATKRYLAELARVQGIESGPEALRHLGDLKAGTGHGMK
jgi:hypothetical protein